MPAADARTEAPDDTPAERLCRLDETLHEPVTFTVSAVAVGMSISRVLQHHMISDGAGDGRELFRWPWNGRLSFIVSLFSTLR